MKENGFLYNYWIIFRISEFMILRGLVLEDVILLIVKYLMVRGLFFKEVLEYVVFEFNV